jgi:hypothetical protein
MCAACREVRANDRGHDTASEKCCIEPNAAQDRTARDCHIAEITSNGRMAWQKATGYNQRSRGETLMGRLRAVIGSKLKARDFDRQVAEIQIRAAIVGGIHGHAVQSCRDLGAALVAGQFRGQGGADVLRRTFGLRPRAGQPKAKGKQPIIVAVQQARKSLPVTICSRSREIFIAGCHTHHNWLDAGETSILGGFARKNEMPFLENAIDQNEGDSHYARWFRHR